MRGLKITYQLFLLIASGYLYSSCSQDNSRVRLPRMAPTYSYKDKLPLGLNVAHRLLNTQFENTPVQINSKPLDKAYLLMSAYDTGVVYILITNNLILSPVEANYLLNFVAKGNTVFISAQTIDTNFTKDLAVKMIDKSWLKYFDDSDSAKLMRDNTINISNPYTGEDEPYRFFYESIDHYFEKPDSSRAGIFGKGPDGLPNFLGIRYGSGDIWIHSNPVLFSNYFLLTSNNHEYLEKVFSYINNKPVAVYWDDYYRTTRYGRTFSSLQVFLKYPALKWALLLGLGLLLLYVAFSGKRKQKIIPSLQPNINSSVSFVQTVGLLYLQKKDNRNIALKMITYFFEHVRNHYFLTTHVINDEFVKSLSRKSGVGEERIKDLNIIIENVNNHYNVTDMELLDLHNRIQEFYKQ
jgi:hypothetical protein